VLPRIKHLNFLASTKALLVQASKTGPLSDGQLPLTRPLAGDLLVSYAFDKGHQYESLRVADAQALGLTVAERVAMSNLRREIEDDLRPAKLDTFNCLLIGNGFEATTLLLDDWWDAYAHELGCELRMVVPSRDLIGFIGITTGGIYQGKPVSPQHCLRVMCRSAMAAKAEETNHGLSDCLFAWRNSRWVFESTLIEAYEQAIVDES
jgi:hypothetical protein